MADSHLPAPAVVFLPGLNTTRAVWDPMLEGMAVAIRAQALDCPALDTVEAVADAIALSAPERFHLVGFSFGGYVALAMLERYPQRIESLVMVGSAAGADNEAQRAYRENGLRVAAAGGHEALNTEGAAATLHEASAQNPEIVARYLTMMRAYGRDRYMAHLRACMARPDRTGVLAATPHPVLFVTGEQDRVVSLRRQQDSARAARADLRVLPGAGHQVPLEQPIALAEVLSTWISDQIGRGAL
jgi:pimeloyl-ACP methyl ester carboxylesterase